MTSFWGECLDQTQALGWARILKAGAIYIDNSGMHYTLLDKKGISYPQATYWPTVHGSRRGFLKEEFDYFLKCVAAGKQPTIITPQESRNVVEAMKRAEMSARENKVMMFD